jgi:hypothetical protein
MIAILFHKYYVPIICIVSEPLYSISVKAEKTRFVSIPYFPSQKLFLFTGCQCLEEVDV